MTSETISAAINVLGHLSQIALAILCVFLTNKVCELRARLHQVELYLAFKSAHAWEKQQSDQV